MPVFNRPEATEYGDFYQTYVDNVPGEVEDIVGCLKRQGLVILNLLRGIDDATADRRYEPGKWSVKEVIGHMIDTERLFAFRALWLARGDGQAQPGMDPDHWARHSNADRRTLPELWREQHVARTDHLYLLKGLEDDAVNRRGICSGAELTVRAIPWIIAGHERHHLGVLKHRYRLPVGGVPT